MKFFLALLASQQTLAESGVDGSCVAEEVSLMQSRHRAAKENETVHGNPFAIRRRRSLRFGQFYLSAPGATECLGGDSVAKNDCKGTVRNSIPYTPSNMRGLQKCSGGGCSNGGWGRVPNGCSVQSGGDWAAHFKAGPPQPVGHVHTDYQLVCTVPQGWPDGQFYWAHYDQKTCSNGGDTVSAFDCAFVVNYKMGATMNPLAYDVGLETCNGNGWGKVPTGCSARTVSDGAPHFKEKVEGGFQCASDSYQLVCTTFQGCGAAGRACGPL